jgi:hypothetical protein
MEMAASWYAAVRHDDLPYLSPSSRPAAGSVVLASGREYTLSRCAAWEAPRNTGTDRMVSYWRVPPRPWSRGPASAHADSSRVPRPTAGRLRLLDLLVAAGRRREGAVERLAALCARHRWLVVTRELNPVWQLIWGLCRGPFAGSEDPVAWTGWIGSYRGDPALGDARPGICPDLVPGRGAHRRE